MKIRKIPVRDFMGRAGGCCLNRHYSYTIIMMGNNSMRPVWNDMAIGFRMTRRA